MFLIFPYHCIIFYSDTSLASSPPHLTRSQGAGNRDPGEWKAKGEPFNFHYICSCVSHRCPFVCGCHLLLIFPWILCAAQLFSLQLLLLLFLFLPGKIWNLCKVLDVVAAALSANNEQARISCHVFCSFSIICICICNCICSCGCSCLSGVVATVVAPPWCMYLLALW